MKLFAKLLQNKSLQDFLFAVAALFVLIVIFSSNGTAAAQHNKSTNETTTIQQITKGAIFVKNVKAGHAQPIVCLDAGHYGKYNRSPAVPAYYESDMNWKLHNMLKAELEQYGIMVKQTRSDKDKDLSVYNRGVASDGCDLFLSIHSNAVGNGVNEDVDYPVVYVQLDGKGDALGNQLAAEIERLMDTKQNGRINKREGKSGEYYGVLRGAAAVGTMGMILEHSFHTNTRSTKWLMDDSNLQKLAQREAELVAGWFGMSKKEESADVWYCVQIGAYSVKKNAEAQLAKAKAAGFADAYIETKPKNPAAANAPEPAPEQPAEKRKTIDELALEVIDGKWGNGAERKQRLTAAGYDYAAVQKRVNEMLGG